MSTSTTTNNNKANTNKRKSLPFTSTENEGGRNVKSKPTTSIADELLNGSSKTEQEQPQIIHVDRHVPPPPPPVVQQSQSQETTSSTTTTKEISSYGGSKKPKPILLRSLPWKRVDVKDMIPKRTDGNQMYFVNLMIDGHKPLWVEVKGELVFTPSEKPKGATQDTKPRLSVRVPAGTPEYLSVKAGDARCGDIYEKNAKKWKAEDLWLDGTLLKENKPVSKEEKNKRLLARERRIEYKLPDNADTYPPAIDIGLPVIKNKMEIDTQKVTIKDENNKVVDWTTLKKGFEVTVVFRIYLWGSIAKHGQKAMAANVRILSRAGAQTGAPEPSEEPENNNSNESQDDNNNE